MLWSIYAISFCVSVCVCVCECVCACVRSLVALWLLLLYVVRLCHLPELLDVCCKTGRRRRPGVASPGAQHPSHSTNKTPLGLRLHRPAESERHPGRHSGHAGTLAGSDNPDNHPLTAAGNSSIQGEIGIFFPLFNMSGYSVELYAWLCGDRYKV